MFKQARYTTRTEAILRPVVAIGLSLLVGVVLIFAAGENPLPVYWAWISAGFGCRGAGGQCALLTALQFSTPLLLSGLSALVALRAGLISIGQFGQMIIGAGVATFLATALTWHPMLRLPFAIVGGVAGGALWGAIPGVLKAYLGVNEVIVTILLNPVAGLLVGPVSWLRIPVEVRLTPLVATTKLTIGFVIAVLVAAGIYALVWRSARGLEMRTGGSAEAHAVYSGINPRSAIVRAMMVSGGLAGLGGALEVLGVHYRFVANFSSIDQFDGITVALLGQLHPLGVVLSAIWLGGLRLGTLNGLQLQTDVPRELGNVVIGLMMLFVAMPYLLKWKKK